MFGFMVFLALYRTVYSSSSETPINLSVGKPSYQPTTLNDYDANRGNDGDRDGTSMRSCFRTTFMFEPFWMVDLEDIFNITMIDLYNRLDCCSERARHVEIATAISNDTWSRVAYYENPIGISVSTDIDNVHARYVKITLKDVKEYLHLCEVEVFGYEGTDDKDVKQITTEDSNSPATVTVSPLSTTEETVKVTGTKTNDWTETSIPRKSSKNPATDDKGLKQITTEDSSSQTTLTVRPLSTTEETVKVTGTKTNDWTETSIPRKSSENPGTADKDVKQITTEDSSSQTTVAVSPLSTTEETLKVTGTKTNDWTETSIPRKSSTNPGTGDTDVKQITTEDSSSQTTVTVSPLSTTEETLIVTGIKTNDWTETPISRKSSENPATDDKVLKQITTEDSSSQTTLTVRPLSTTEETVKVTGTKTNDWTETSISRKSSENPGTADKDVKQITTEDSSSQTTVTVSPLSTTEETVKVTGTKTNDWTETSISRKSSENPATDDKVLKQITTEDSSSQITLTVRPLSTTEETVKVTGTKTNDWTETSISRKSSENPGTADKDVKQITTEDSSSQTTVSISPLSTTEETVKVTGTKTYDWTETSISRKSSENPATDDKGLQQITTEDSSSQTTVTVSPLSTTEETLKVTGTKKNDWTETSISRKSSENPGTGDTDVKQITTEDSSSQTTVTVSPLSTIEETVKVTGTKTNDWTETSIPRKSSENPATDDKGLQQITTEDSSSQTTVTVSPLSTTEETLKVTGTKKNDWTETSISRKSSENPGTGDTDVKQITTEDSSSQTTVTVSPLSTTEETVKVTGTKTNDWTETSIPRKSSENPATEGLKQITTEYSSSQTTVTVSPLSTTEETVKVTGTKTNDWTETSISRKSSENPATDDKGLKQITTEDSSSQTTVTVSPLSTPEETVKVTGTKKNHLTETSISPTSLENPGTADKDVKKITTEDSSSQTTVTVSPLSTTEETVKVTGTKTNDWTETSIPRKSSTNTGTGDTDVKQITTENSSSQTTLTVSPLSTTEETVKVTGTKTNDWTETSISRKSSENLAVDVSGCPASKDYRGQQWNRGVKGTFSRRPCPSGYKGEVKRYCDKEGAYTDPVYNCTSTAVADIYKKVFEGGVEVKPISVLNALTNVTSAENENNGSIMLGDMDAIIEIMSVVAEIDLHNMSSAEKEATTDSFMETTSNIIGGSTSDTWKAKITETGAGVDVVLDNVDRFLEKLNATDNVEIKKPNLYVKKEPIASCVNRTVFPNRRKDVLPEWMQATRDVVFVGCNNNWNISSFSGIIYRNLSQVMPSTLGPERDQQQQINTPVVSFTFHPNVLVELRNPVEISFETYSNALDKPICTFWKKGKGPGEWGYWSRKGCWLHQYNKHDNTVVCKCDHLTNFAVLMSLSSTTAAVHQKALNIITKVGLITSSVFLFLTIVVYGIFWRHVKSDHTVVKLNLSCVLFLANLLFLTGVDRTDNKVVCTVIAAFLHLLYLCVFFIMLALGLDMVYMVVNPHNTQTHRLRLLFASYGLAVITVSVSMGVVQLEGYGNDKFCWLSVETGLIWSFLVPILVVILTNLINTLLVIKIMCGTKKMSKGTSKERVKSGIRSVLILMPIMGLTWLFGIFSIDGETVVFQYLFAVFNSLQGVFIFIFHCVMNRNIQVEFRKLRARYLSPETRSTTRTIT